MMKKNRTHEHVAVSARLPSSHSGPSSVGQLPQAKIASLSQSSMHRGGSSWRHSASPSTHSASPSAGHAGAAPSGSDEKGEPDPWSFAMPRDHHGAADIALKEGGIAPCSFLE